jgi:hypothetical protein
MKKNVALTWPEFMFVVGTRAILAAGIALFIAGKLSDDRRRIVATTLVLIGAVTTIPAAMALLSVPRREERVPDEIVIPD